MKRALVFLVLGLLVSLGISAVTGFGINVYQSPVGYVMTVEENNVCKDIRNAGTKDVLVPAKTTPEFNSFTANLPTGVTVSDPANAATCCASQCNCTKVCFVAF